MRIHAADYFLILNPVRPTGTSVKQIYKLKSGSLNRIELRPDSGSHKSGEIALMMTNMY